MAQIEEEFNEADFPDDNEPTLLMVKPPAAVFKHEPSAAYTLSSQLTLSATSIQGTSTPQVFDIAVTPGAAPPTLFDVSATTNSLTPGAV